MFGAGWSDVGDVTADRIGGAVRVVDLHGGVLGEYVTTIQDGEHLFFYQVSELGVLKGCPDGSFQFPLFAFVPLSGGQFPLAILVVDIGPEDLHQF